MSASAVKIWVLAARVRTLPAAIAPVLVGTSLAISQDEFDGWAFAFGARGPVRSPSAANRPAIVHR